MHCLILIFFRRFQFFEKITIDRGKKKFYSYQLITNITQQEIFFYIRLTKFKLFIFVSTLHISHKAMFDFRYILVQLI